MGKKNENKVARVKKRDLENMIIEVLNEAPEEGLNYKQICTVLGLKKDIQKAMVVEWLTILKDEDRITESSAGKCKINNRGKFVIGTFERKKEVSTSSFRMKVANRSLSPNETPDMR